MRGRLLGIAAQIIVMAIVVFVVLLFIGISMLVLIHVCIVRRAFRRSGFGNTDARRERDNGAGNGLSPDDLEKLPCYDYMLKDKDGSAVECAVCLESFRLGDKCRLLPECKHSFHTVCVDSWLLKAPICPICRTDQLIGPNGMLSRERQLAVVEISASAGSSSSEILE